MLLKEIKIINELDDTPFADAMSKVQSSLSRGWNAGKKDKEDQVKKVDDKFIPLAKKIVKEGPTTVSAIQPIATTAPLTLEDSIDAINSMMANNNAVVKGVIMELKDLEKIKTYCTAGRLGDPSIWMQKIRDESRKVGFPVVDKVKEYLEKDSKVNEFVERLLDPNLAKHFKNEYIAKQKALNIDPDTTKIEAKPESIAAAIKLLLEVRGVVYRRLQNAKDLLAGLIPPTP